MTTVTANVCPTTSVDTDMSGWSTSGCSAIASELRPGGKAMKLSYRALYAIPPTDLLASQSYTLTVVLKRLTAAAVPAALVRFKTSLKAPSGPNAPYRIWTLPASTTVGQYETLSVDFVCPKYVANAEFVITATGGYLVIDSVTFTKRTPIVLTEPITSTVGSYAPAGMKLVFNDEFEGTTLNRSKWWTRYIYNSTTQNYLNDEEQRYCDNDNHVVANSVLSLVARKVTRSDGIKYESGMIRSDYVARSGYFEARVKMPSGIGMWPAFWLNSDVDYGGILGWPPEIDIFEFVNNGITEHLNMLHSGLVAPRVPVLTKAQALAKFPFTFKHPNFDGTWTFFKAPYNFSDDWHTVAGLWTANAYSMYIDGELIYTRTYGWHYNDGTAGGPAHILLNLAVGGSWANPGKTDPTTGKKVSCIDDSCFPQSFQIDWVRVYQ